MLPQARKEDKMFSGCSRWTAAGENRQHLPSARNLLTLSHLTAFSSLAVNSPVLYFHHLTHIQNRFLEGAAPESRSKPLIRLQIADWKAVTSTLGFFFSKPGWHAFLKITLTCSFTSFQTPSLLWAQNLQSSTILNAGEPCREQNNNCLCFRDAHNIQAQWKK